MSKDKIFEKINSLIDIEKVAEYHNIKFNSSGKAKCPFHDDNNPSFSINKKKTTY